MRMQFLYNKTNLKMSKKFFLALLAPLFMGGLVACNKQASNDLNPEGQSTGDTYMSVTFSTANPNSLKAEDPNFNSIGEFIGRDKLDNVNVYVINLPEETVDMMQFNNTQVTENPDQNPDTKDFRTKAWKTTAGKKIVYVYANIKGTDIETALNAATSKTAFEAVNKQAFALTENGAVKTAYASYDGTNDIIAMNSTEGVDLTVEPGIKENVAEAGTKNCAKATVRRLVGQAAVTAVADKFEIKDGADVLVTLNDLQWDVMQFEQETFLAPQPIDATATPAQNPMLTQFCKSPSFEFITTATNYTTADAGAKYAYRAFTGEPVATFTRDADNKVNVTNIVKNPMKFITETTHQFGGKLHADDPSNTGDETGYRKGNTAYVIVSAQITPQGKALAEGQTYTAGNDLFYGVQDKKFYADEAAAKAANKSTSDLGEGRDNVIKCAKGICYYVAWLNPDVITDPVKSPVLRNNIYHVNINAIKKLGYSGNPFNPNGDDPKDPDDKTPDPKETLYPNETWMSVEINVVNWGVHSYDQEF